MSEVSANAAFSRPRVSVVVPTFNRRASLERLVDSLRRQTLPADHYEIVIVSDGSTDGTLEMLAELKRTTSNLDVVATQNRGPGAARNAGARLARGEVIAFTDDDCVVAPDWLQELLLAFERTGAIGIQGKTSTDRQLRTPLTHQVEALAPQLKSVPTCNAAYKKVAFEAAGRFDETFRFAHDEDADLAWRVEDLGEIAFAPTAHVCHPPRPDSFWKRAGWVRGLESEFLLFRKNRSKYRNYVSWSPWWTIYWKVFVIGQLEFAAYHCKYLIRPFKPRFFVVGMALLGARWLNLIRFFPNYLRAARLHREMDSLGQKSSPSRGGTK